MKIKTISYLISIFGLVFLPACQRNLSVIPMMNGTPTYTATALPTGTFTSTFTHTPTGIATNTPSETMTNSPTGIVNTSTPTNTATNTQTGVINTSTYTATSSATGTWTLTPTFTPTNMVPNTATNTFTVTNTQTNTATNVVANTSTDTPTGTNTLTSTPTNPVATSTHTATPTTTYTFSPTPGGVASWHLVGNQDFSISSTASALCMAMSSSGVPYVGYLDGSSGANVQSWNGSTWVTVGSTDFVTSNTYLGMALDSNNVPYVVYADGTTGGTGVKYYTGSTWQSLGSEFLNTGCATQISEIQIVCDGTTPYVTGYSWANTDDQNTAVYQSGAWTDISSNLSCSPFPWSGLSQSLRGSIAIYNHTPYLYLPSNSYFSSPYCPLLAEYQSSQWNVVSTSNTLGSSYASYFTFDTTGKAYVANVDSNHKLTVAYYNFSASSWTVVGAPQFATTTNDPDSQVCLVFKSGVPYVIFSDANNSNKATVMTYNGTSWVSVGSAGFSPSAAYNTWVGFNGSGQPFVSFQDGSDTGKVTAMAYY